MALFPFILYQNRALAQDAVIRNHELIHHRQQLELLIIPFYFWYLFNYVYNRLQHHDHYTAYRQIIFEQEAYAYENDLQYLKKRKWFAFLKFIR